MSEFEFGLAFSQLNGRKQEERLGQLLFGLMILRKHSSEVIDERVQLFLELGQIYHINILQHLALSRVEVKYADADHSEQSLHILTFKSDMLQVVGWKGREARFDLREVSEILLSSVLQTSRV